jgi:hypothetical protein
VRKKQVLASEERNVATPTAVVSRKKGLVVVPLRTELQRLGTSRADSDAWVILTMKDYHPLDVDFLRDTLTTWPRTGEGKVCFSVYCVTEPGQQLGAGTHWPEVNPAIWRHQGLIEYGLRCVAREARFAEAVISVAASASDDFDWDAMFVDLEENATGDLLAEESAIGDDPLRVYPVRTAVSRFMHVGAQCVVFVDPPRRPMPAGALAEIEDRAVRCLEQLPPEHRRIACFSFDGLALQNEVREGKKEGFENLQIILRLFMSEHVWRDRMRLASWVSAALD